MSAREDILARVRGALVDRPAPPPAVRDYVPAGARDEPAAALLDRLEDRLIDYRAEVQRVPADGVGAAVTGLLARHGATRIAVPAGLPRDWLAGWAGEQVPDEPVLTAAELDALDGVLTGCRVAIASTGTIVLDGGAGMGRRALTLVPDLHVVVVTADQVVPAVPDALPRLDPHRPLTWISGPSATSDIELNRVEGVHGPRRLAVLLPTPS